MFILEEGGRQSGSGSTIIISQLATACVVTEGETWKIGRAREPHSSACNRVAEPSKTREAAVVLLVSIIPTPSVVLCPCLHNPAIQTLAAPTPRCAHPAMLKSYTLLHSLYAFALLHPTFMSRHCNTKALWSCHRPDSSVVTGRPAVTLRGRAGQVTQGRTPHKRSVVAPAVARRGVNLAKNPVLGASVLSNPRNRSSTTSLLVTTASQTDRTSACQAPVKKPSCPDVT
ncbi:hypothetical protein O3P69_020702 [Scylla paramamosain]|uniref:Uncharacterized protein n=1 Tax=Scylla paramamosain TaxID=85552 RepID=A0AAW0TNN7_SCYPA